MIVHDLQLHSTLFRRQPKRFAGSAGEGGKGRLAKIGAAKFPLSRIVEGRKPAGYSAEYQLESGGSNVAFAALLEALQP